MNRDESGSKPPSVATEWTEQRATESTKDRVYAVAIQLYEPTRVATVSDDADVSKETAREYLKWFAEIGMITQDGKSPDLFSRNESYFEWRRIQRLRGQPIEELERKLEQLVAKEREYGDRYEADAPENVDALEHADYADLDSVWMDLQEWQTVRGRIRELERARRSQNGNTRASA